MKASKAVLAVAAVLAIAAAGCADSSGAARPRAVVDENWACSPDQIATSQYELATEGGYKTTDAALLATTKVLASDGVADQKTLVDAAASAGDSGRLVVEGEIVADVAFAKIDDGTWTVSTVRYCSPPPGEAGSPAPTPADDAGAASS